MAGAAPLRFMALFDAATRHVAHCSLAEAGIDRQLGHRFVPVACLHQSLSGAVPDTPLYRQAMLRAGEGIAAAAVSITFDRVRSTGAWSDRIHWSMLPRGRVDGFDALLATVRASLGRMGIHHPLGHTAHVTVSYDAPGPLRSLSIAPVTWTLDEVCLVVRHDRPFRYETLARWPLAAVRRHEQLPFPL